MHFVPFLSLPPPLSWISESQCYLDFLLLLYGSFLSLNILETHPSLVVLLFQFFSVAKVSVEPFYLTILDKNSFIVIFFQHIQYIIQLPHRLQGSSNKSYNNLIDDILYSSMSIFLRISSFSLCSCL